MSRVDEARALLSAQHYEDYPITTAALLALVEDLERERNRYKRMVEEDWAPATEGAIREATADLERRLAEATEWRPMEDLACGATINYECVTPYDDVVVLGDKDGDIGWLPLPAPPAPEEPVTTNPNPNL